MCEKASQTRNPIISPRSRLPRPQNVLSSSNIHRSTSVGNLSSRAESPLRNGSSRIPVGHQRSPHERPVSSRYDRNGPYMENTPIYASTPGGLNYEPRGSYNEPQNARFNQPVSQNGRFNQPVSRRFASTPDGLNYAESRPLGASHNHRSRDNKAHYASSPMLNHQQNRTVRFSGQNRSQGRSMVDLRDIEESIQDIGVSLHDIKQISQSIQNLRTNPPPPPDDEVLDM
jgi:hypothetical protein